MLSAEQADLGQKIPGANVQALPNVAVYLTGSTGYSMFFINLYSLPVSNPKGSGFVAFVCYLYAAVIENYSEGTSRARTTWPFPSF